jgi:uncharacterized membrane protein (UPF0127 family)
LPSIDRLARFLAGLLLVWGLVAQDGASAASTGTLVLKTETGEHSFTVEVAETDRKRALGLMFRRSLPDNGGMLFLYDRPQSAVMWMKNTLISLDMVFIAPDGRVHRIEHNTEPFSTSRIFSEGVVAGVLELKAGAADRIGLKRGDLVIYPGLGGSE